MLRKFKIVYSIFVGISIISLWILLFTTGQVPEIDTEPFNIILHVFSELLLAVMLIVSGIGLIRRTKWSSFIYMLSMGMLVYSVINAAGYYGDSGDIAMVAMFALLLVISIVLTVLSLKEKLKST